MPQKIARKRVRAVVEGRVQGVGFRYFTLHEADRIGLTGWVRNLPNGAVECVAEGTETELRDLVERLEQGPSFARVSQCQVTWTDATGEFGRFTVAG